MTLTIRPARRPSAARLATYADHRMAMAAAVLGLAAPGTLVEDVGTVGKTLPTFTRLWADMLGQTQRNGEIAQESVEKRGQGSGQDAPRSRGASTRNGGA